MQTPPTLVEDLLATRKNIVTTDCVYLDDDGAPTDRHCDGNSWAETDASRKYLAKADPSKPLFLEYGGARWLCIPRTPPLPCYLSAQSRRQAARDGMSGAASPTTVLSRSG